MAVASSETYHLLQTLLLTLDTLQLKAADEPPSSSSHFVTEVDASCDGNTLVFGVSDDTVQLVDAATNVVTTRFKAHADTITCVCCSQQQPNHFLTAGYDNTVKLWDARSPDVAHTITFPTEVLAATTLFGDTLLAASQENAIHFVDIRNERKLGIYDDCHTDSVTRLKRSPAQEGVLASAADDCLVCCYDVSAAQQQDAVLSIMNTECPIARIGFFGSSYEGIYCLTGVETMSLWHFPSAQRINTFDNIRNNRAWPLAVEYLVDCIYSPEDDMLRLYAGTHAGQMVECAVSPSEVRPVKAMPNGHRNTVRCVVKGATRLFTGGEDARVCVWSDERPPQAAAAAATATTSTSSTHPVHRKTAKDRQFRPYPMPQQRKK